MPSKTGLVKSVDKDICLEILDRGLYWSVWPRAVFPIKDLRKREIFRGQAKDCNYFHDPEAQEVMRQHDIGPETRIAVAAMENPLDFAVIRV